MGRRNRQTNAEWLITTLARLPWWGVLLGAFYAAFMSKGLGVGFTGWLMIHGVTEIFAITLAGGAGNVGRWRARAEGVKARGTAGERERADSRSVNEGEHERNGRHENRGDEIHPEFEWVATDGMP